MDHTHNHGKPLDPYSMQKRSLKESAKQSVSEASKTLGPVQYQLLQEQMRQDREKRHRELAQKSQENRRMDEQSGEDKGSNGTFAFQDSDAVRNPAPGVMGQDQHGEGEPITPPKKKKGLIALLVICGAAVLFAAGVIGYFIFSLRPVGNNGTTQYVTISEGETISDAADLLKKEGLIRDKNVFKWYASFQNGGEVQIQAGRYKLSPAMSCQEILTKMVNGDITKGEIEIVIPEGKNLNDIAGILEEKGVCSADAFKRECSQITTYQKKYPLLSSIPTDGQRTLEGYLFPATYYWDKNTSPTIIVDEMIGCFSGNFTEAYVKRAKEMDMTVDEVIIVASIIELESKYDEDKANIASVLYNRIETGMPLQCDSTVDYVLGSKHESLSTEQTKVESPYNTYINYGLPIGPVSSPGMAAIKAALYPAQTDYLYFVSDLETGKTYFNVTLDAHEADVSEHMK